MKNILSTEQKIEAINLWQTSGFHPLTCGECRENLKAHVLEDKNVVLICSQGHIQRNIPSIVFEFYLSSQKNT